VQRRLGKTWWRLEHRHQALCRGTCCMAPTLLCEFAEKDEGCEAGSGEDAGVARSIMESLRDHGFRRHGDERAGSVCLEDCYRVRAEVTQVRRRREPSSPRYRTSHRSMGSVRMSMSGTRGAFPPSRKVPPAHSQARVLGPVPDRVRPAPKGTRLTGSDLLASLLPARLSAEPLCR
jgi:hypothetical protein